MGNFWRPTRRLATMPRGVTLLELLVVLTIMLMVTAAAIPIMLPAVQNRRMREASRLVSSYISGARARAIETGRPVGVMFERFNGLPFAMVLSYVEVPPPYAGDTVNSRMNVTTGGQVSFLGNGVTPDTQWTGLIRVGDLVKLDFKGPLYLLIPTGLPPGPLPVGKVITTDPSTAPWQLLLIPTGLPNLPANYSSGVAFQIFRQPVRSSAAPMQLPEGVVVDLASSGDNGPGSLLPAPLTFNPSFAFSPAGTVIHTNIVNFPYNASLFFLLGRRDLMPDVQNGNDLNMFDLAQNQHLQNFWVSIGYQTGQVTVTENGVTTGYADFAGARRFAQGAQSVGGR